MTSSPSPQCLLLFLFATSAFLIETVIGIKCFVCSRQSSTHKCPDKNDNYQVWGANSNAYYDVTASNQVHACVLGYSTELAVQNQVFYQGHVTEDKCTNQQYLQRLGAQGRAAVVKCCTRDGCNWNHTTMLNNMDIDDFGTGIGANGDPGSGSGSSGTNNGDGSSSSSSNGGANVNSAGAVVPEEDNFLVWILVVGIILALLFLICCFCCLCYFKGGENVRFSRANKRKKQDEERSRRLTDGGGAGVYGGKDGYGGGYGRGGAAVGGVGHGYNGRTGGYGDDRSDVQSATSRLDFSGRFDSGRRGSNRINVAEADRQAEEDRLKHVKMFSERNHERYSAVDRRLYQNKKGGGGGGGGGGQEGSDFNSGGSTPMNQDGPYAADQHLTYNKLKVDELSRNVFDNPEFRQANQVTNNRDARKKGEKEDWHHVWKNAADPDNGAPVPEQNTGTNAFTFAD